METRNSNTDNVYICSGCFGKLASFMLTNPALLKQMGLPKNLRVEPVGPGIVEPCEKCNVNKADGIIPCVKAAQVVN